MGKFACMKHGSLVPAFALLYLVMAHADQNAGEKTPNTLRENCDDAPEGTQFQLGQCAQADYHDADKQMTALYVEKMRFLDEPAHSRLRDAQRAWITFRDKSCLYEAGSREESGTSWGMDVSMCLTVHTQRRIKELKEYIACTQNGCPN